MSWIDFTRPDLAPVSCLGLLAVVLALLDAVLWPRRRSRAPGYATLFGLLLALAVALQAWDEAADDPAGGFAQVLVLGGAVLAALLAAGASAPGHRDGAGVLIVLAALGAAVTVSATDLVLLFAGLELSALSLTAFNAQGRSLAVRATIRFAGPTVAAGALNLLGVACLWSAGGPSWAAVAASFDSGSPTLALTGAALLFSGMAVRAGVVPFHLWVADVTVGCAPAAAALTVSVAVVPALVVIGRLAGSLVDAPVDVGGPLLAVAALTTTAGNLLALPQRRLTRLLGYGVVAHVGYALAAVATGPGLSSSVWLQLAVLVPAVVGCLSVRVLTGDGEDAISGLARRRPAVGVALCLFALALAGLPPTAAFAARGALFAALAASAGPVAGAILLANVLLTAYVFVRFASRLVFDSHPEPASSPTPTAETVSAVVLAAAVLLLLGLWPAPLADAAALAVTGSP